ncbi:hypothetical protein E4T47_06286 [Aureobasidium subglaciale]|nr:hypothetical protein E4T43_05426 [Aureobasidium subglaciale]KAI5270317.1 hypothetical protein E4T47_06286 [Aureobasidium subglaciale]
MKNSVYATAALVAAAAADSVGSAIVVNKCNYDVTLVNVPSANGGYSEVDKTLSPSDTYTQKWTSLTNGNGWSIKLSNSTSLDNILQYEYTYQNDGTIWYDLSEINGNPWNGNWEITANSGACTPKQQAYRYATDDAYGMQSCAADAIITVTLCSGEDQNDSAASSASTSVAAESTESHSVYSATASAPATSQAPTSTHQIFWVTTSAQAPATTLQTSVITQAPSADSADVIVTATYVVTTTQWTHSWGKREHQHRRHPHGN